MEPHAEPSWIVAISPYLIGLVASIVILIWVVRRPGDRPSLRGRDAIIFACLCVGCSFVDPVSHVMLVLPLRTYLHQSSLWRLLSQAPTLLAPLATGVIAALAVRRRPWLVGSAAGAVSTPLFAAASACWVRLQFGRFPLIGGVFVWRYVGIMAATMATQAALAAVGVLVVQLWKRRAASTAGEGPPPATAAP